MIVISNNYTKVENDIITQAVASSINIAVCLQEIDN